MTEENGVVDDPTARRLVSAVRTSLGDTLRSVVVFTPSAFDVLYVRTDLYDSEEDARAAKERLVELERVGFAESPARTAIARRATDSGAGSEVGAYEFTVRFHERGFVVRVIHGDVGVLLTADSMDVNAFEDAVSAVRGVLDGE